MRDNSFNRGEAAGDNVINGVVRTASAPSVPLLLDRKPHSLLLEHPHTPASQLSQALECTQVLRSGDHGGVARCARAASKQRTRQRRPRALCPLAGPEHALTGQLTAQHRIAAGDWTMQTG